MKKAIEALRVLVEGLIGFALAFTAVRVLLGAIFSSRAGQAYYFVGYFAAIACVLIVAILLMWDSIRILRRF